MEPNLRDSLKVTVKKKTRNQPKRCDGKEDQEKSEMMMTLEKSRISYNQH